jgi:hypothetical protein
MPLLTFRDTVRLISPSWLRGHWGERYLYVLGAHLDALGDWIQMGLKARFPSGDLPSALPYIARGRGIVRGAEESDDLFASRLRSWLPERKRKGNPYALMRQLRALLTPPEELQSDTANWPRVKIINDSGEVYELGQDGAPSRHRGTWDWDGCTDRPTRRWIVLYAPTWWTDDGEWGDDGDWGDGGVWGSTATIELVDSIRALTHDWTAPHAANLNIILVFDLDDWDSPSPTGNWDLWPNRSPIYNYWEGNAQ